MARFDRKPAGPNGAGGAVPPPDDPPFVARYPVIWEYLTVAAYDSGDLRKTSTVLCFVEDGSWKACLNDRDGNRSLWVTAKTFLDVLGALERALDEGSGSWRQYQPYDGRGKKRP